MALEAADLVDRKCVNLTDPFTVASLFSIVEGSLLVPWKAKLADYARWGISVIRSFQGVPYLKRENTC